MAKWSDKLNQVTQSAISKSKEVAGVAKLNMDNASLNMDVKNIQTEIGAYVLENRLLMEDPSIKELVEKAEAVMAHIEDNNEKIRELKNINVCPECGAEVARSSRFCNRCGAELTIPASASEMEEGNDAAEPAEEAETQVEEAAVQPEEAEARAEEEETQPEEAEARAEEAEIRPEETASQTEAVEEAAKAEATDV